MCLILLAYRCHSKYPFVLIANRDEFYARPSLPAHWWQPRPQILAGKDLEAGGTWMGVSLDGRFAAVTNVREPQSSHAMISSRGKLPLNYLANDLSPKDFSEKLEKSSDAYKGYNLIFGHVQQPYYYSNRTAALTRLTPGFYGLSNATLDTPWPKVQNGKQRLKRILSAQNPELAELFELLADPTIAPDSELPQTGVSLEWERQLSAISITGEDYGTRASTVLIADNYGNLTYVEKTLAPAPQTAIKFKFCSRT